MDAVVVLSLLLAPVLLAPCFCRDSCEHLGAQDGLLAGTASQAAGLEA